MENRIAMEEGLREVAEARQAFAARVHRHWVAPMYFVWGVVWMAAFTGSFLAPSRAGFIWMVLVAAGACASAVITVLQRGSEPVRSSRSTVPLKILGLVWAWAFAAVWLLRPESGIALNGFLTLTAALSFLLMGLSVASRQLIVMGALISGFTLAGLLWIPAAYYSLWMAVTAGGVLLGAGVLEWKAGR